ncbi:UbiA family prenyltransferase [Kiritimatiellota bacterium B12222]|nr:UbiA family prenyltransferase [Kiritimatiellota bacterium B12222]
MFYSSCLSWIRFLRLPAVLTVPGDVWVGAALVGGGVSYGETLAVCCAYLFGMGLNDVVDVRADRVNRPERPLPQGDIPLKVAISACIALCMLSWVLNPCGAQVALLGMVTAYNTLKHLHLWLSGGLMAGCRILVLWMGAGAPGETRLLWPLWVLWGYLILMIILLADLENKQSKRILPLTLGLSLWWLGAPVLAILLGAWTAWVLLPWGLLIFLTLNNLQQIFRTHQLSPKNTGVWLSMLIPLQASFLCAFGDVSLGLVVLLAWPLLKMILRKIQIS